MKKTTYIVFILSVFVFQSCKKPAAQKVEPTIKQEVQITTVEDILKKYMSKDNIPYLLKEEVDSIRVNKEKFQYDSGYRNIFKIKASERNNGIRKLKNYTWDKTEAPGSFKMFLLPEELSKFHKDSISEFVILYELYKQRRHTLYKICKVKYYLTNEELHTLIKGSFKDSVYYRELAAKRFKTDSINSVAAYKKMIDSLKTIIRPIPPIDSLLPFGPKSLGRLLDRQQNTLSFRITEGDTLIDPQMLAARKEIYQTWQYFLEFHYYEDDEDPKILHSFNSYQYVKVNGHSTLSDYEYVENQQIGTIIGRCALRLSNINGYEVYYATTGDLFSNGCFPYIIEDSCCFGEDYECNSTGTIVLYDRKAQHSIIIGAFALSSVPGYGNYQQFFYIDSKGTIHVFDGDSSHSRSSEKYVHLTKSAEINILKDGKVIVEAFCEARIEDRKDLSEAQQISRYNNRVWGNNLNANKKRLDSILNTNTPLQKNYPFGAAIIKTYTLLENEITVPKQSIDSISDAYKKLFEFRNKPLPVIKKINQINLGLVEQWDGIFTNRFLTSDCYYSELFLISDFRLPNIGAYEVHYKAVYGKGVLILYDSKTETANVLNVFEVNETYFRFFYINENSQIEIYQGLKNNSSDPVLDATCKITKTHIINVQTNGTIKVTQQN